MTTAQLAARLIRSFEGLRLKAYWDATGKVWSIAYGHTAGVKEGDLCSIEQAERWLEQDSAPLLALVKDFSTIQGAVLVSFGYNCGIGPLRRVLEGDLKITLEGFINQEGRRYGVTSGGVLLEGLAVRRALEAGLFIAAQT